MLPKKNTTIAEIAVASIVICPHVNAPTGLGTLEIRIGSFLKDEGTAPYRVSERRETILFLCFHHRKAAAICSSN